MPRRGRRTVRYGSAPKEDGRCLRMLGHILPWTIPSNAMKYDAQPRAHAHTNRTPSQAHHATRARRHRRKQLKPAQRPHTLTPATRACGHTHNQNTHTLNTHTRPYSVNTHSLQQRQHTQQWGNATWMTATEGKEKWKAHMHT